MIGGSLRISQNLDVLFIYTLSRYIYIYIYIYKAFSIKWNIRERVKGRLIGGECRLCVTEKLHIIEHPEYGAELLNSNSDIKCMHGRKHKLFSVVCPGRGQSKKKVKKGKRGTRTGVT